jgi:hypothetical protein
MILLQLILKALKKTTKLNFQVLCSKDRKVLPFVNKPNALPFR